MKKVLSVCLFILLMISALPFFITYVDRQYTGIDSLQSTLQKFEQIVPKSATVYYFSGDKDCAGITSGQNIIYPQSEYKTSFMIQFILAPRIVTIMNYQDIPPESFILIDQQKDSIVNTKRNTGQIFDSSDSLLSVCDGKYYFTLLKKKR